MKTLMTWSILLLAVFSARSQDNSTLYRAKILLNSTGSRTGVVTMLSDSAVQIIRIADAKAGTAVERLTAEWIPVAEIREMRFRKVNGLKSGVIGGAAAGLLLGALIGNITYEPCDPTPTWLGSECDWEVMDRGASTVFGAIAGLQIGAGIGILIGTANKKYLVGGSRETYLQVRTELGKFVMR